MFEQVRRLLHWESLETRRKNNRLSLLKKINTGHVEEDGSGSGQGTSAEYKITDERCVSPAGNPTKGKDLVEG